MSKNTRRTWWILGSSGALLLGSGVSIALEASHYKHLGTTNWQWILGGILGIACIVSGVVFLIRAGIIAHELKK